MIRERLIEEIERRFSAEAYRIGEDNETVAVFPARSPEVGDITILHDGFEATVYIGSITHGHFSTFDDSVARDLQNDHIAKDVGEFLAAVFRDRVLFWKSEEGDCGGWVWLDYVDEKSAKMPGVTGNSDTTYFLWSGPCRVTGE